VPTDIQRLTAKNSDVNLNTTYPVTYYSGAASDFVIVLGTAHDILR